MQIYEICYILLQMVDVDLVPSRLPHQPGQDRWSAAAWFAPSRCQRLARSEGGSLRTGRARGSPALQDGAA